MIERDLMAARDKWIEEAKTEAEKKRRLKTDFLCYSNHDGLFADFHSRRHLFITSLERAGISPKMAQTLARHGDIRLTLGVYTHVGFGDRTAAIESLPGPPRAKGGDGDADTGRRLSGLRLRSPTNASWSAPCSSGRPARTPRGVKGPALTLSG
jgi:hypothetical protein